VTPRNFPAAQAMSPAGLSGIVQAQASVLAYADITYLIALVSIVLVPFVFIVRRPPKGRPLSAETG